MTEPTKLTTEDLDRLELCANPVAHANTFGPVIKSDTVRALVAGYRQMLAAREQLAQAEAARAALLDLRDDLGRINHGLPQRAQAADADCAALREALERAVPVCSCPSCRGHRSILASPNPGAGLQAELEQARKRIAELEAAADTPCMAECCRPNCHGCGRDLWELGDDDQWRALPTITPTCERWGCCSDDCLRVHAEVPYMRRHRNAILAALGAKP